MQFLEVTSILGRVSKMPLQSTESAFNQVVHVIMCWIQNRSGKFSDVRYLTGLGDRYSTSDSSRDIDLLATFTKAILFPLIFLFVFN